jgi:hypothetical protein
VALDFETRCSALCTILVLGQTAGCLQLSFDDPYQHRISDDLVQVLLAYRDVEAGSAGGASALVHAVAGGLLFASG